MYYTGLVVGNGTQAGILNFPAKLFVTGIAKIETIFDIIQLLLINLIVLFDKISEYTNTH